MLRENGQPRPSAFWSGSLLTGTDEACREKETAMTLAAPPSAPPRDPREASNEAPTAGHDLATTSANAMNRPATEKEVRALIRDSDTVENISALARRLGWSRSKLNRFLDREKKEGRITCSIGPAGRTLIAVSDSVRTPVRVPVRTPDRTPVRVPQKPSEVITLERARDRVSGGGWWNTIGRGVVGLALVGLGIALALTSMQANAWFGHSLTTDETAGEIFTRLSVLAEIVACVLPSAIRFYWRDGDRWTALRGNLLLAVALIVVFFAVSGFVLTNLNDSVMARAERTTPTIEIAQLALDDAKAARDRECVKVGPICRMREDAVSDRQHRLDEAMAEVRIAADPQAAALHVTPNTLRTAKAGVMVMICLTAGYIIALGLGLLFRRRPRQAADRAATIDFVS